LSPDKLWLRSAVRFWKKLMEALAGSLHRAVAKWDWARIIGCRSGLVFGKKTV